jgi:NTE family protein
MKKKVQLVLGSGGARGIAHIGVIQLLLQDGYEIVEVVGCSMGAVIGGMYCAGFLPQYSDWLLKQTKSDVYRLFDITFSLQGFVKGERIFGVLEQLAGKQQIESLAIPFTAIATDMLTRTEVHFSQGDLYKALRASTGIPGVFTPVAENNRLFVDGGVLNPLPVNTIKRRDDAIVIAVNLNGAFSNEATAEKKPETDGMARAESESQAILTKLRGFFNSATTAEVKPAVPHAVTSSLSVFELLNASYDATLDRLVEVTLEKTPVDVLVEIPRNVCSTFEFYRAAELINIGKTSYTNAMVKSGLKDLTL